MNNLLSIHPNFYFQIANNMKIGIGSTFTI
jgi:hypothetical protein